MSILFSEIVAHISKHGIVQVVNPDLQTSYRQVRMLSRQRVEMAPGTLYIGDASLVPESLVRSREVGLILTQCGAFRFSTLQGNAVEVSTDADLPEVLNDVLEALNARRRTADSSAALLACLVEGKGLRDLIQLGAELLGNPVSLVDSTGKLLVISDQGAIQDTDLTPEGYLKQEKYSTFRTYKFTKRVNESPTPIVVNFDHAEMPRMIIGRIAIRNAIVGHLAVTEMKRPFADDDVDIVKVLIDVISSQAQVDRFHLLMAGIHHEYFILDLLQDKQNSPTTVEERVQSLQWDAYSDFYVAVISIPRKDDAFYLVEYLRTRLAYLFPFSKSAYYEENVVLVIYRDQRVVDIATKLSTLLFENNLAAGISLRFPSIMDLKRHYEQARRALSIGRLLKSAERTFAYDDFYIYDLLTIINRNAELKDFCHPSIGQLRTFDEANGTDYYDTLVEYLMNNANMAQVARNLHIHRNTLYHRLRKISEITGLDLESGDAHLKLLLSSKIMELFDMRSELALS